jgi:hypothetical protein
MTKLVPVSNSMARKMLARESLVSRMPSRPVVGIMLAVLRVMELTTENKELLDSLIEGL